MSDVLIIGGGIAGLSAGARIAQHAQVTVLEAEDHLGYHASGRSAALYEPNYGSDTIKALSAASADFYMGSRYLSPRGLLIMGRAQDTAAFEKDMADLKLDEITLDDAQGHLPILNPDVVTRAAYNGAAHDIDTDQLLQTCAKEIKANGGVIATKSKVTEITKTAGGWAVTTANETYQATTLVNAAGAWADEIAKLAGVAPIGIVPHRRSMARIPLRDGLNPSRWPMFFGVGETWYAKPDAGKLIVSPADEEPTTAHDAYADDMVLAEGLARFEEMVMQPVTRVESNWAGLRSFAPDRALVLGRDAVEPEFVWCAGQGGYGFQTAPAAAQLVADHVLGARSVLEDEVVAQLSPQRFG